MKLIVTIDKIRLPIGVFIHIAMGEEPGLLGTYSRWHEPNTRQCQMSVGQVQYQETKLNSKSECQWVQVSVSAALTQVIGLTA